VSLSAHRSFIGADGDAVHVSHRAAHADIAHRYHPSVTTRDRHGRHWAVRNTTTAQVAVPADKDAVKAAKGTAVLIINCCRTVLTERCCYVTK